MNAYVYLRRVGAFAIDAALAYVFLVVVIVAAGSVLIPLGVTGRQADDFMRWPLIALYFIGFWLLGATPGMRLMRISVQGSAGGRPTPIAAIVRFAVLGAIAAINLGLLGLYAVVCVFGVYPHDALARTTVRRDIPVASGLSKAIYKWSYVLGVVFFVLIVGVAWAALASMGDPVPRR